MKGGTYARAIEVGFTEDQAGFFSHFGIDLKQEALDRVKEEIEASRKKHRIRNVFVNLLRSIADNLEKKI